VLESVEPVVIPRLFEGPRDWSKGEVEDDVKYLVAFFRNRR
jgi:hypothetical protein